MELLPDRLPLVIGVTGHRDLRDQDVARLEREVSAVIARLRHDYLRGKGDTPIIVLSALAEGADRRVALAAEIVMPQAGDDGGDFSFEPGHVLIAQVAVAEQY